MGRASTEPFPEDEPVAICEDTTLPAGPEVRRDQVVVSVFNGSKRSGLAGRHHAPSSPSAASSRAPSATPRCPRPPPRSGPPSPTTRRSCWCSGSSRRAKVVQGDELGPGVVVVVGEKFQSLKKKQVESVVAEADATLCKATGSE